MASSGSVFAFLLICSPPLHFFQTALPCWQVVAVCRWRLHDCDGARRNGEMICCDLVWIFPRPLGVSSLQRLRQLLLQCYVWVRAARSEQELDGAVRSGMAQPGGAPVLYDVAVRVLWMDGRLYGAVLRDERWHDVLHDARLYGELHDVVWRDA